MKNQSKVVIAICTYNGENRLEKILNSAIKIKYDNYCVVVVDNNSSDKSQNVIEKYQTIKLVVEKKRGIANARNKALDMCTDDVDYLAFLDDDEEVECDWINKMLEVFKKGRNIIAVGGPYIPVYEKKKPAWMPENFFAYRKDFKGIEISEKPNLITGNAMIDWRKAQNLGIRFDSDLGYNGQVLISGEDVAFFNDLVKGNNLFGFTEYAAVKHYIDKRKLTFKWITRRNFFEGVTQYYRFGKKEVVHSFFQLPLKIVRVILALGTFDLGKMGNRFFKLVHCAGALCGPFLIKRKQYD